MEVSEFSESSAGGGGQQQLDEFSDDGLSVTSQELRTAKEIGLGLEQEEQQKQNEGGGGGRTEEEQMEQMLLDGEGEEMVEAGGDEAMVGLEEQQEEALLADSPPPNGHDNNDGIHQTPANKSQTETSAAGHRPPSIFCPPSADDPMKRFKFNMFQSRSEGQIQFGGGMDLSLLSSASSANSSAAIGPRDDGQGDSPRARRAGAMTAAEAVRRQRTNEGAARKWPKNAYIRIKTPAAALTVKKEPLDEVLPSVDFRSRPPMKARKIFVNGKQQQQLNQRAAKMAQPKAAMEGREKGKGSANGGGPKRVRAKEQAGSRAGVPMPRLNNSDENAAIGMGERVRMAKPPSAYGDGHRSLIATKKRWRRSISEQTMGTGAGHSEEQMCHNSMGESNTKNGGSGQSTTTMVMKQSLPDKDEDNAREEGELDEDRKGANMQKDKLPTADVIFLEHRRRTRTTTRTRPFSRQTDEEDEFPRGWMMSTGASIKQEKVTSSRACVAQKHSKNTTTATNTIYVSGLNREIDEVALFARFGQFGPVRKIELLYLPFVLAYIHFGNRPAAARAIALNDGCIWLGQRMACGWDQRVEMIIKDTRNGHKYGHQQQYQYCCKGEQRQQFGHSSQSTAKTAAISVCQQQNQQKLSSSSTHHLDKKSPLVFFPAVPKQPGNGNSKGNDPPAAVSSSSSAAVSQTVANRRSNKNNYLSCHSQSSITSSSSGGGLLTELCQQGVLRPSPVHCAGRLTRHIPASIDISPGRRRQFIISFPQPVSHFHL